MTIHYGTADAERVIRNTPPELRVGFLADDAVGGIETLYALHPVTREIRARTTRIGSDGVCRAEWREAHHIPPDAACVGRCERLADSISFAAGPGWQW